MIHEMLTRAARASTDSAQHSLMTTRSLNEGTSKQSARDPYPGTGYEIRDDRLTEVRRLAWCPPDFHAVLATYVCCGECAASRAQWTKQGT